MPTNVAVITGNLTADPVLRMSKSSRAILNFGIANNQFNIDSDGNRVKHTNFIDCALFGKRAEALSSILKKGMKVTIKGSLHWSSWEKSGQKLSKISIWVDDIDLMSNNTERESEIYNHDIEIINEIPED